MAKAAKQPKQPAESWDDFGDPIAGGSATRFAQDTADRIVAFLTAKQADVTAAISGGKLQPLPVTIPVEDLNANEDRGRSLKGNTAYDYREAIVAHFPDLSFGTKWVTQGDQVRLHLSAPRKRSK